MIDGITGRDLGEVETIEEAVERGLAWLVEAGARWPMPVGDEVFVYEKGSPMGAQPVRVLR